MNRPARIILIIFGVVIVLYGGLIIYRLPAAFLRQRTNQAVAGIKARKINLVDVLGQNLPPKPEAKINNSTLLGLDQNHNGVRDDLEPAIFKLYLNSARARAAALQYALALQTEMSAQIFNPQTLTATLQQEDRAYFCLGDSINQSPDIVSKKLDNLFFNTPARQQQHQIIFNNYMTTYTESPGTHCDIDAKLLPN